MATGARESPEGYAVSRIDSAWLGHLLDTLNCTSLVTRPLGASVHVRSLDHDQENNKCKLSVNTTNLSQTYYWDLALGQWSDEWRTLQVPSKHTARSAYS